MRKLIRISGFILLVLAVQSCKKADIPTISTLSVSEISYSTASSGGEVKSDGGSPVIARGICWNSSPDPTILNSKTSENASNESSTSKITGLSPNTTYYVKAYATNSAGTGYGNEVSFITLKIDVPVLTTKEVTSITPKSAVSGGNVIDEKGAPVTERGVCWNTMVNPAITDHKSSEVSGTGEYFSQLTPLIPNTIYYLRAYAINSSGIGYGNEVSFTSGAVTLPTLTTENISIITKSTVLAGGAVTNDGGADVTIRGVCWSTSPVPTINNFKTSDGTGPGIFESKPSGLIPNTIYYLRSYATNSFGTGYGNEVSFKTRPVPLFNPNLTYGSVTDIDGNVYKTIAIGTQVWMAENLKVTKFNDGTLSSNGTNLVLAETPGAWGGSFMTYCWYNNDTLNKDTYGALYNWYAASTGKLCPTGWHVPTSSEFSVLSAYLGGESIAGNKLKESGNSHWKSPNTGATNQSGFTALPGGLEDPYSNISSGLGSYGSLWSSTSYAAPEYGIRYSLSYENGSLTLGWPTKQYGFAVRCLKD